MTRDRTSQMKSWNGLRAVASKRLGGRSALALALASGLVLMLGVCVAMGCSRPSSGAGPTPTVVASASASTASTPGPTVAAGVSETRGPDCGATPVSEGDTKLHMYRDDIQRQKGWLPVPPPSGARIGWYLKHDGDAVAVFDLLRAHFSMSELPARIRRFVVYDHQVHVETASIIEPEVLLVYKFYEDPKFEPPVDSIPVPDAGKLGDMLFDLRCADLAVVPRIAQDAVAQAGFKDAFITDMVLERGRPYHPDNALRWYVYVESGAKTKEGLMAEYDTTGRMLRVWRPKVSAAAHCDDCPIEDP